MKTFLFFAAIVGFVASFSQCSRETFIPIGEKSVLAARQSVTYTVTKTEKFVLAIDSIQDNRCPCNADCSRQGEVRVWFTASQGGESQSGKLCLGDCPGEPFGTNQAEIRLLSFQYQIIVQEINPGCPSDPNQNPPKATLVVRKK